MTRSRPIGRVTDAARRDNDDADRRQLAAITAHLGWGLALTLCPGACLDRCNAPPEDPRLRGTARVLGLRHLAEAVALVAAPSAAGARRWCGAVDALHALTMVPAAARGRPYRVAAGASLAASAVACILEVRT